MNINLKALLKGIAAGCAIALGGIFFCLISFFIKNITNAWLKILPAYSFSIGLIIVCFSGFYLCTGKIGFLFNDLILKHDSDAFKRALLDLLIMIIGNIIGATIFGIVFGLIAHSNEPLFSFLQNIAKGKYLEDGFKTILKQLIYSALCGALVYIAVFSFKTFKNKFLKALGIIIAIGTFVYFGFFHCIANVFYFAMTLSFNWVMVSSFLVQMVGNFIGALILNFIILAIQKITKKTIIK